MLFVQFVFPYQTRYSITEIISGLLNPAVQSLHSTPAATREYRDLWLLFPVLDIKLRQRGIRQRKLKVRGQAHTESEFVLCAPADNDDELDDDLPFLKEQPRATLRPKISTAASNAGSTLQRLSSQPQNLPPSSWLLQDQTNQQGVDDITRSTLVEFAPHSPKPSSSGDDG